MSTAVISSEFKIEIPKRVRRALGLRPGQKVRVAAAQEGIRLAKHEVDKISSLRGILKGKNVDFEREVDRL